jgi:hypothetical protein
LDDTSDELIDRRTCSFTVRIASFTTSFIVVFDVKLIESVFFGGDVGFN